MSIKQANVIAAIAASVFFVAASPSRAEEQPTPNMPVSVPIDTESAGKGGEVALRSVLRILCRSANSAGTGFLHKSGKIITAAHVVKNCQAPEIVLNDRTIIKSHVLASDSDIDLALIEPSSPIEEKPLIISSKSDFKVGDQVSTWGFPGGYIGPSPMLSVGYLSGIQEVKPNSKIVNQWVINAAFNRGNSGGPLLQIETGEVIGVVSSKVAPLAPDTLSALQMLENNQNGLTWMSTSPDGAQHRISESQIIAMVLEDLRNQVQLVIGNAVKVEDIRTFLSSQKIDP
jgi:S1-C subfamily serine protease